MIKSGDLRAQYVQYAPAPNPTITASKALPLIAWALMFLCWPIGLALAYIDRGNASAEIATHYRYMIRTFWIGLLYAFASLLLSFVLVGLIAYLLTFAWYVIRIVKGFVLLLRDQPVSNPATWLV